MGNLVQGYITTPEFFFSEMSFHCLGDWEGPNGQRYVALMDTQAASQNGDDPRPRYRCAVSHLSI